MTDPRRVVLLGSTGSIGTQALDVIARHEAEFDVVGLAAGGGNIDLLAAQVLVHRPEVVGVARASVAEDLQLALYEVASRSGFARGDFALPRIVAGPEAATEVASHPADVVLNGMTGSVGLGPTLAALAAGSTLALANKESLIAGGPLVLAAAAPGQIVPVDSEHSALAQCLLAGDRGEVRRLLLTASGGPFRMATADELATVTPEQALAHPTWDMGPVVTINSATMVNKGLEVIEAHLLFGIAFEAIDVVVHPQSIVHSMVEFVDGNTMAQVSPPDMRLPIALGLTWPHRLDDVAPACDWSAAATWDFAPLDDERFPAVALAKEAGVAGGTAPAVFNAANEECVAAFLAGNIGFTGIVRTVSGVVAAHVASDTFVPGTEMGVDDVARAEAWARAHATHLIKARE